MGLVAVMAAGGGRVLGRVMHPFNATDFSSALLSAQASGAKVIGLANGAGDTINSLKQAHEFGMLAAGRQKLAALLLHITDIHSIGLQIAQGTQLINTFYWDRDDASRAWSRGYMERMGGRAPAQTQAAIYGGVLHYLKAVKAAGSDDGLAVAEEIRRLPVEDFYSKGAAVRRGGRVVRDHLLYEVKTPAESRYPYDCLKPISVVPGETLVRPLAQSERPFARQP